MTENESKYRQASQTPFMQPPLLTDFGYLGIGPNADAVMQGNYQIPPGVDVYTRKFIDHLRMEPEILQTSPIETFYTTEEWKTGWKKAKERTTSGSNFLHFGHFKAGCTNDVIANFEATMANIPLLSGYSPPRWRKAVDCMLLKKEGNYRVDKLRTIVLFDPEANQNFKFLGRAVMAHAENTISWRQNNMVVGSARQQSFMLSTNALPMISFDKPSRQALCAQMMPNPATTGFSTQWLLSAFDVLGFRKVLSSAC